MVNHRVEIPFEEVNVAASEYMELRRLGPRGEFPPFSEFVRKRYGATGADLVPGKSGPTFYLLFDDDLAAVTCRLKQL